MVGLRPGQVLHPRLLVMTASGDSAAQYMNYMNIFFTAQVVIFSLYTFTTDDGEGYNAFYDFITL